MTKPKQKPSVRPSRKSSTPEGFLVVVRKNRRRKLYYVLLRHVMYSGTSRNKSKGGFKSAEDAEAWAHAISALEGSDTPTHAPQNWAALLRERIDNAVFVQLTNSEN